jgi:hypothetical protein
MLAGIRSNSVGADPFRRTSFPLNEHSWNESDKLGLKREANRETHAEFADDASPLRRPALAAQPTGYWMASGSRSDKHCLRRNQLSQFTMRRLRMLDVSCADFSNFEGIVRLLQMWGRIDSLILASRRWQ